MNTINKRLSAKQLMETFKNKKGVIVITLEGPDAHQALAELLSNIQWDNLDVDVKVGVKQ